MIWMISRRTFPGIFGSGDQVWNFAYLPDVVQGHLLALERALPGRSYILGGENLPLEELVRQVQRHLGRGGGVRRLPLGLAETIGGWMERWAEINGKAPQLTRGVAAVYRCHWSYDSSAAEHDLGYRRTPWREALAGTIDWARALRRWEE